MAPKSLIQQILKFSSIGFWTIRLPHQRFLSCPSMSEGIVVNKLTFYTIHMYRWHIHILLEGRHAQNLKFAPSGPPPNRHCPHKLPLSVLFPVASSSIHIKCNVECNAGEKIKKMHFWQLPIHPKQLCFLIFFYKLQIFWPSWQIFLFVLSAR